MLVVALLPEAAISVSYQSEEFPVGREDGDRLPYVIYQTGQSVITRLTAAL